MTILLISLSIGIISFLLFVLWVWAMADILSANFPNKKQKWWWFAAVLIIPLFGMIAYYIWGSRKKKIESEYAAFLPDAYPDRSDKSLHIIYKKSGMGLRNGLGQTILPAKYQDVKLLGDKLAAFTPHLSTNPNKKFGLIHHSGELLLPAEFDEISEIGDSIFIRLGKEVQQFDLEGKFLQVVSEMPG